MEERRRANEIRRREGKPLLQTKVTVEELRSVGYYKDPSKVQIHRMQAEEQDELDDGEEDEVDDEIVDEEDDEVAEEVDDDEEDEDKDPPKMKRKSEGKSQLGLRTSL